MEKHLVILFYKYIHIEEPKKLLYDQKDICMKLFLSGRVIIAHEGINGTLEGTSEDIKKYQDALRSDQRFIDVQFKESRGNGKSFPGLSIKVRNEIVIGHLNDEDINPNQITGKRLSPEDLHQWFQEKKDFTIVDMRNEYEQIVGHFKESVLPGMKNFRDLSTVADSLLPLKKKTVLTVCTGGVRCEKASGYLLKKGFENVYQLDGGIVSYMEKFPSQNFVGSLYVFDGRNVIHFDQPEKHTIIGTCAICSSPSERYVNCKDPECHYHFICCEKCAETDGSAFCNNCTNNLSCGIIMG